VLDWNLIAQDAIAVGRPPASSQVLAAIVQVAVYDTVVAIGGGARPYAARPKPTRPVSTAAAAAAAHHALVACVPGQAAGVDTRYAGYLAAIPDGPAFEPVAPTPPVDVALAQVRPLTFRSPSRFRPDGPTRLGGRAYARDLAEVQALGRADSTVRSPAQTEAARFWSENTPSCSGGATSAPSPPPAASVSATAPACWPWPTPPPPTRSSAASTPSTTTRSGGPSTPSPAPAPTPPPTPTPPGRPC
jgi:hypothetical protein